MDGLHWLGLVLHLLGCMTFTRGCIPFAGMYCNTWGRHYIYWYAICRELQHIYRDV